jgi:mono/diheme cytochrome c family protein
MRRLVWIVALMLPRGLAAQDDPAQADLAKRAYNVLQTRCYRCHGGSGKAAGLDVSSRDSLLQMRGEIENQFAMLVPGDLEASQLWGAVSSGYMPDEGSAEAKAMTDADRDTLQQWIEAGAPFPTLRDAKFVTEKETMRVMRDFLFQAPANDRPFLRFFTLTNIHNNPKVSEKQLRTYRAALSMVINSLSLERSIELPKPLPGTNDCVYVIDLRRVGWDREDRWGRILSQYPYGLKYHYSKDEEFQQIARDVELLAGTAVPCVRADWFVVRAAQPPLYHELLGIPDTLPELEQMLGLDSLQNIVTANVARAGFSKSNVSQQNRLIERHETPNTPYYWISYDFKPRRAKGDLMRFPLGPKFDANIFNKHAFDHDGGEVIWSLPNGLQGYMLVLSDGNRIDRGPVDVVFDKSPVIGTPEIVNGISCMICHRQGMIMGFRDEVREADAVGGDVQKFVQEIYPPHEEIDRLTQQDKDLFMRSLSRTIGPFLLAGEDKDKPIESFPQPVSYVAEQYMQDLTAEQVAWELGIEKFEELKFKIEANRELLKYGLGNLTQDPPGTMKREKWEALDGTSLMQDVSLELRVGTPYRQSGFTPFNN